ncbi:type VI secretion system baseplate subunit TssE [Paraburkholderia bryophila]|jgi:type VI secretion system lysozyme-like protein|uniref:Type VI secretion system lysozyme-like protein n=1 Tax=Paraburkholderia bryophila TaxID=420952 RepID=A0A329CR18_9BURK|nr:type VI secretion system baseplate subunit TssE [Paraburkholderia bryophila]RAS33275.1 type VI secretion system lysozyme-like protein [Paraburkholderia bryophila]WCM24473.1 type VI secretion system baseplate subunit TssE [Paraburkholderia bryophila]
MRYLFERLAAATPTSAAHARPVDLGVAVAEQIQRMVATRPRSAGDASDLLGFGMLNVVDVSANGGAGLTRYAARLKRMIERFEPRLAEVEVTLVPDANPLMPNRLRVSGVLRSADAQPFRVLLDAATGAALEVMLR